MPVSAVKLQRSSHLYSASVPSVPPICRESPNLNLIRAAAVICVVGGHLHYFLTGSETALSWHFGQIGVIIFFVHTSLVLMMSLDRSRLSGLGSFRNFYIRRIFRLYPLSIFCVTLAFVLGVTPELSQPFRHWTWPEFLSNLTLTTNLFFVTPMVGGLWTLPLEVQMYVALPFFFRAVKKRPVAFPLAWWIVAVALAMVQQKISQRFNVVAFAPCFIAGVVAWRLRGRPFRRLPGWLWPFAFVASWQVFLLASLENIMYYRWAFSLLLGLMIPCFGEVSYRPLTRAAAVIAKYSYGIYLSHIALILFSFGLHIPRAAQWVTFLLLSVCVPVAMFHLIENPMILAGQAISRRFFPQSRAAAA